MLARNRGFTGLAVLMLALGIAANTAVFGVVRAVLLRQLPYSEPERLFFLWREDAGIARRHGVLNGEQVAELIRRGSGSADFAVLKTWQESFEPRMDLLGHSMERLRGALVTPNFFEVLGVSATLGRSMSLPRDVPSVVLGDSLWRRHFRADPAIVGTQVVLTGGQPRRATSYTIVGVLPASVRLTYPDDTELWAVLPWEEVPSIRGASLRLVARLHRDAREPQFQAEMSAAQRDLNRRYPGSVQTSYIAAESLPDHVTHGARAGTYILWAVALAVFVIGCVNLALVAHARVASRSHEFAVRRSLGASQRGVVRYVLIEGMALAIGAGLVGVLLAMWSAPLVRAVLPPFLPRGDEFSVDRHVLGFAALITFLSACAYGLTAAWLVVHATTHGVLNRSTGRVTRGSRSLSRELIIALQSTFVVLLMVSAFMLLRSFQRLQDVDLGFNPDGVVVMELNLVGPKYFRQPERVAQFRQDLLERIRAIPMVQDASLASSIPMRGVDFQRAGGLRMRLVEGNYFGTLNISLLQGRTFTDRDQAGATPVVILSESLARRTFGGANPIGRAFEADRLREVVGVVDDVRYQGVGTTPEAAFYVPLAQQTTQVLCLIARSTSSLAPLVQALRETARGVDPEQPIERLASLNSIVKDNTAEQAFQATAATVFTGVAVLLALAGLVGVVSRALAEREREVALRLALGASPRSAFAMIVRSGLRPVIVGTACGMGLALAGWHVPSYLLYPQGSVDIVALIGVGLASIAASAAACALPARRALRNDLMTLLKSE